MDIPLQFHEFQHLDHYERCPKYTESLTKSDPIAPSDLDALYTDLENLQGAANIRLRRLEEEVKILTEWCDKKDRSKGDVDLDFLSNVASGKRTRTGTTDDALGIKKQKLEDPSKSGSSKIKSKGKATTENSEGDVFVAKPKLTYDGSNKFWSYVEPYCADITIEDIRTLEESLESKVDINEYFKIPPLGKHYSEVWAKEDLIEEHQQSAKIDKKKNSSTAENNSPCLVNMDSNILPGELEENCPYGKFTKILIAALVDENIMAPMTENEILENNENEPKPEGKVGAKRTPLPSAKSLEAAIKEELFSLGLIDTTDTTENDQDDEIFQELRRCQSELKAVRCHNKYSVNKLIALAKNAIKNQEVRQKAKVLDAEVQDVFRRFCAAKAKKKGLSRKDREFAWKTIRDREALWKLVDSNDCDKPE